MALGINLPVNYLWGCRLARRHFTGNSRHKTRRFRSRGRLEDGISDKPES